MSGVVRVRSSLFAFAAAALLVPPAAAQQPLPQARLAAPADCMENQGCGVGLKAVYGLDAATVFSPLASADAGISALDDGVAEVAVVFSSSPALSRPDILSLDDDKAMIGDDHVLTHVRTTTLRKYGSRLSRPVDAISAVLTTLQLRGLNQQVADGRLPDVVGAEFAESNALASSAKPVRGRTLVVGFVQTAESRLLAGMYGAALRNAGFKVRLESAGGLRPEAYAKFRQGKFDLLPAYSRSAASFLAGKLVRGRGANVRRVLRREARKIGATPMRWAPATDNNVFAMKRDTAARLGITKLSDLSRFWPSSAG